MSSSSKYCHPTSIDDDRVIGPCIEDAAAGASTRAATRHNENYGAPAWDRAPAAAPDDGAATSAAAAAAAAAAVDAAAPSAVVSRGALVAAELRALHQSWCRMNELRDNKLISG